MYTTPAGPETIMESLAPDERSLAEAHAFLKSGAAWPGEPPPQCLETHASLVYLTRDRAWKLKKPVRLMHVDQVSLGARAQLCREELRLNRALSGDVYRGLTPLVRRADGSLALGGAGQIIDWLIESVRLPEKEMLDRRLVHGPDPKRAEIKTLCDTLVGFYLRQPQMADAGTIFNSRLLQDVETAIKHLHEMTSETKVPAPEHAFDFTIAAVKTCQKEIAERGFRGLFVEGHGDLRAEHVCLTKPPVVFDRLEIDHGIRTLDPFYEMNALGLECGLLGSSWIRAVLLAGLSGAMAPPSRTLLTAYGVIALLTRARFAADHFRDDDVAKPEKWRERTKQNVAAAAQLLTKAGET